MFRHFRTENLVGIRRSLVVCGNDFTSARTIRSSRKIGLFTRRCGHLSILLLVLIAPKSARSQTPTLTNKWSFPLGARNDSSAAIGADGTIYFGTWEGNLMALSPNGSLKWSFRAGREIQSSPALGTDGTVYFGCRNRKFYAATVDGQEKWEFKTGAWVDSSPAIGSDGAVYFGSWDNNFYALDSSGARKWVFQTGGPVVSSPAIGADATIYFGSHDLKFYALKPDGTKAWEYLTGGAIISSPAIDNNGTIYITSVDGFFYALHPDGSLKWRLKTAGITESSPVIGGDGTLFIGVASKLWAISPDGEKEWDREATTYEGTVPIDATPLVFADGSVCVVSSLGRLSSINKADPIRWVFQLQGHGHSCPALDGSGTIYIGGSVEGVGHFFYALPGGTPLAKSPWPKFRRNARNTGNISDAQ